MVNKFVVDLEICKNNDVEIDQILYLFSLYFKKHIRNKSLFQECRKKGLVVFDNFGNGDPENVELSTKGIQLIETIILDSEYKEGTKSGDRYVELAKQLQELYPEGKKAGTQYYWRDSVNVIVKRLKAITKKYGECFTNEQAIEATRKYVASFNGDYKYMQLLKYFICKNVIKGGEVEETSQLLSYIENNGQADTQQLTIDWETELR